MKIMKKVFLFMILAMGLYACKEVAPKVQGEQEEEMVTFQLGYAPDCLKVGFLQTSADKVHPKFDEGDPVYVYLLSGDKLRKHSIQRIKSVSINQHGFYIGTLRFVIPKVYDKLLFSCVPLQYDSSKKQFYLLPSPSFQTLNAENATVPRFSKIPAYAVWNKGQATTDVLMFEVQGSVLCIELDNNTDQNLEGLLTWSADKKGGGAYTESVDNFFLGDASLNGISLEGENFAPEDPNKYVTLKPGENYLATYIRPIESLVPDNLQISLQVKGHEKITTEKITRKKTTPWLNKQFIFLPKVIYAENSLSWYKRPKMPTSPMIRIISSINRSEFRVQLDAEEEDRKDVWVDVNNNGKFDSDEGIAADMFGTKMNIFDISKGLSRQKLHFYGKITKLSIVSQSLTEVELGGVSSKLKTLNLYGNAIKGTRMDKLIQSLPDRSQLGADNFGEFIVVRAFEAQSEDNEITKAQVSQALTKGWRVYDSARKPYAGR